MQHPHRASLPSSVRVTAGGRPVPRIWSRFDLAHALRVRVPLRSENTVDSRLILTIRHPTGPEPLGGTVRRSTSTVRRACAVGTTIALVGLSTGLGIMTATSASAAEATTGTSTVTGSTTTAPADGTATTDAPAAPTDAASAPTTDAPAPADPAPASDAPTSVEPAAPTTTDPATTAPSTTDPTTTAPAKPSVGDAVRDAADAAKDAAADAPVDAAAVASPVDIVGDATYGGTLNADADFDGGTYEWTDERGTVLSTSTFYEVGLEAAGQHVTVTITGPKGEIATGTTEDAVPPVFLDTDGTPLADGDETSVEAVAGERFSATFHAESTPAATYSIEYVSYDDEDTATLPEGVTFDAETGTLSGTLTSADDFAQFIVTATATDPTTGNTTSSTLFVDVDLQAAAPAGILVAVIDADGLETPSLSTKTWLIDPDGAVSTGTLVEDPEDYTPGGRISVPQGGSLVVYGLTVDRFGNLVMPDFDEETGDDVWPKSTVTSDVASDVIEELTNEGGPSIAQVTFPHASTHTLTVSSAGVPSTSFAVEVVPTATAPVAAAPTTPVAAAAPVRPVATTGRLAYTGADESAPIAWALGLLVAGAGLIGARTLRRRRTQR